MLYVAFMRASPALMIVFCIFNCGVARLLSDYLDPMIMNIGIGMMLGVIGLFLGTLACGPYRLMLTQVKGHFS